MPKKPKICSLRNCCVCCMLVTIPPFTKIERKLLSKEEIQEFDDHWHSHELNTPCYWLDQETKLCKNYDRRPQECREFVIDGPECNKLIELVYKK